MYTIIGGDGKEYGPVTADQIRSWMAGGRANRDTKVREVGSDTWKTIADTPDITSGPSEPQLVTPASVTVQAGAKLDVFSCYERSWALLKANFWPLAGVSLVFLLIYGSLFAIERHALPPLLGGVLLGGVYNFALLRVRGRPATFGDMFGGFTKAFPTLVVAGVLVSIFSALGLVCLILPGIYLIVAYQFTYLLAVDRRIGFWEAMETSRQVVTRQWWRVLGLVLLNIPFMLLGLAALGIGVVVAFALFIGAMAYAYEDLFNPPK